MNRVLFSAACFVLLTVGLGNDCDMKKVNDFGDCMFKKFDDDRPRWTPDLIKEKKAAIDTCFSSNGCDKPDYERDIFSDLPPNFQVLARKMKSDWDGTSDDIKKCIFDDLKDDIKDELNKCLTKQSVATIKDLPDFILKKAMMKMGSGGSSDDKKFFEAIAVAKINIARAFRLCYENKGEDNVKKVFHDFQAVRAKYMFDKMCTDKLACEKDKLDDTCIKRGDDIETACCKCNEEKRQEKLKKIAEMRKNTGNADMESAAEMLTDGHNITLLMQTVQDCYKGNIPTGMKLLMAMHNSKDTTAGPKFVFNKGTIDTISDITMAMLDHEECYVCQVTSNSTSTN